MATYTTHVRVPADRRLVIDLPDEIMPGVVEVTVAPAATAGRERGATGAELIALGEQMEREGWKGTGRTREEVDAELNAMRDEWDDSQDRGGEVIR